MESQMTSLQFREKGKGKYGIAFPTEFTGGSTKTQIEAGKEAMKYFYLARNAAAVEKDKEAWIFATRNYGFTAFRLASSSYFQSQNLTTSDHVYYYFREAVIHLVEAYEKGRNFMSEEWLNRVETNLSNTTSELVDFTIVETKNWRKRNIQLSNILNLPGLDIHHFIQAKLSLSIAQEGMKAVIKLNESNDWKEALQCLHEMYTYVELTRSKLCLTPESKFEKQELSVELNDLNDTYIAYFSIVQSSQATFQGDHLKNILLLQEESLEMDLAWQVVDHYRYAMTLAQTKPKPSIESEAKASSRLGSFFYKVLKLEQIGHKYCQNALQLMMAGEIGSSYSTEDWYVEAKTIVEECQKKRAAYNDEEVAKQREPTLLIIQPLLDEFDAIVNEDEDEDKKPRQCHDFLTYIYKKHPPKKGSTQDMSKISKDDKNALQTANAEAVRSYYPDKNRDYGMEWFVLCEEIVQRLNSFANYFKGN